MCVCVCERALCVCALCVSACVYERALCVYQGVFCVGGTCVRVNCGKLCFIGSVCVCVCVWLASHWDGFGFFDSCNAYDGFRHC